MTQEQIKAVLERVLTWPPEHQEVAAEVLLSIEQQIASDYQLTDEQVAEVRRRREKKDPKYFSLADVRARFGL